MTFRQILGMPAIAMPFSEPEGPINLLRFRLRGLVLRAGALVYEILRHPTVAWGLSDCDRAAWTREPEWPRDFAFAFGDFEPQGTPSEVISHLQEAMAEVAPKRSLKAWQSKVVLGQRYPYDLDREYRRGEVATLDAMLHLVLRNGATVVLLPLPLYGYVIGRDDMQALSERLPMPSHVFDLYRSIDGELQKFWYDDGHLDPHPAGALATAVMTQHLLDSGVLSSEPRITWHD
jgi:hypothetical protein